jgi:hypothetical protein
LHVMDDRCQEDTPKDGTARSFLPRERSSIERRRCPNTLGLPTSPCVRIGSPADGLTPALRFDCLHRAGSRPLTDSPSGRRSAPLASLPNATPLAGQSALRARRRPESHHSPAQRIPASRARRRRAILR